MRDHHLTLRLFTTHPLAYNTKRHTVTITYLEVLEMFSLRQPGYMFFPASNIYAKTD